MLIFGGQDRQKKVALRNGKVTRVSQYYAATGSGAVRKSLRPKPQGSGKVAGDPVTFRTVGGFG